jgi:succinate dehydrogenase flavin-adding protein (antitoxin of CptAB toxin-antitoxin module)
LTAKPKSRPQSRLETKSCAKVSRWFKEKTMSELERREYSRVLQQQAAEMFEFIERKSPCQSIDDAVIFFRKHPEAKTKPDYWHK